MDRQLISRIERLEASTDRLLGSNLRVTVRGGGSGGSGGGTVFNADTKANLAPKMPNDGQMGYTTGATKRFYIRIDGDMVCVTHLE
jgi:hypothetical protein